MTYADAVQFLHDLRLFGTTLGLKNTLKLAALAGNPHERLRFIHVAGTNGKGSTCAMLESIYRAAGLRVGLFTSPHLVSFCERIQINRQLIPEADVSRLVAEIKPHCEQFPEVEHPTFFEVVTIVALKYFAEKACDLVIWETGLGGRLDATNIVSPLACIITNVEADHQQWLGDTVEQIAFEKAGIIKPGVPVSTAVNNRESLKVIFDVAREKDAPLYLLTHTQTERPPLAGLALPLLGAHQRMNAALAVHTVRVLSESFPISEETMRAGLLAVCWPGRLQLVQRAAGQILLDCAHNLHGMQMLAQSLVEFFPNTRPTFLLGMLDDKDWTAMCHALAPLAGRIHLAPVSSVRTAAPEKLLPACHDANPGASVTVHATVDEALRQTADDPFVVVAGSLYLVGEVMEQLGISLAPSINERGLNEWGAKRQ